MAKVDDLLKELEGTQRSKQEQLDDLQKFMEKDEAPEQPLTYEPLLRAEWEEGEDYDPVLEQEKYIAEKANEGFSIHFPADNELFLDIDSREQYNNFLKAQEVLAKNLHPSKLWRFTETPSQSGDPFHMHIRVRLPFPVGKWARIALQGALGSDNIRELLSCLRSIGGLQNPTIFVEKSE